MKKIISTALALCMVFAALCIPGAGPDADATHIDAEYEDSSIRLWFDYASEKISDSDTTDTGMESFRAYMAKNEIEDIQFVLAADSDKSGMSAEIGEFRSDDGNVLDAEIFIELYHDCGSFGSVPDAIPPLSAYGAFDLAAGKSQAFLIKLTSTANTAAGDYKAMLTVRDSDGRAVKCAAVYAHVWDFALSDETACATSMNLSFSCLSGNAYGTGGVDATVLYKAYYDYLLENRVCAYYLPVLFDSPEVVEYMDDPRVTSFQGDTDFLGTNYKDNSMYMRTIYKYYKDEENAHRFDKAYHFSNIVDADKPAHLDALKSYYNDLSSKLGNRRPTYADRAFSLITTYINDIDYTLEDGTVIDQIEFYKSFINHWCAKTFAYTDISELSVPGAKLMQPLKWDSVYGTFEERMEEMKERGDKVWWFISWDTEAPYINYYMQTDGVAQRILFWQQYDHGVEGFLYNFANFWMIDCKDPYANNITNPAHPNAHGESILIYPGAKYGLNTPVGSLRLEAMRDGIEDDYQMFYMLEEAAGKGAADKYIEIMTTGMVRYSTSDKDYYETRAALGNAVEELISKPLCEHDFVKGVCSKCGETDPDYTPEIYGDVDGNGYVGCDDVIALMNHLSETDEPDTAYDFNKNGTVDRDDAVYLLYHTMMPARYPLFE